MEGLIFALVIFIISSLLGKNKKEDKPEKQMPPFSKQQVPMSKPMKANPQKASPATRSLEDFANEIFGQLNEKAQPVREVTVSPVEVVEVQSTTRETLNEVRTERPVSSRPQLGETRPLVQQAKTRSVDFVPRTQKQLMQAIVAAEILGPPKAKR